MVDPRLHAGAPILCPHPEDLRRYNVEVAGSSRGRGMLLCRRCFHEMRWLARQWHAYQIRPSTVYRRLRELDYSRFDALRFVVQLIADRAQVRIGLLSRGQVDV